jgi:hypothetical protein
MRSLDVGDAADDGAFARHVEWCGPQDRLRSRQRLRRDIDNNDLLALSGQKCCCRGADAAAATGDEDDTLSGHGYCLPV